MTEQSDTKQGATGELWLRLATRALYAMQRDDPDTAAALIRRVVNECPEDLHAVLMAWVDTLLARAFGVTDFRPDTHPEIGIIHAETGSRLLGADIDSVVGPVARWCQRLVLARLHGDEAEWLATTRDIPEGQGGEYVVQLLHTCAMTLNRVKGAQRAVLN